MVRHKKHHDRDKYYNLAKEQGYRSRAAFKLTQINKKFDFLTNAKVLIDLCAAPGGWCQVAAKYMPEGSIVLGVDLLPIRPIKSVKTIVGDITTAETRRAIQAELQGWKADVVLCDGAPNVGAAYDKDAYVQNELALSALKTATDHLMEGGTFCTKVYRSQDYNALMWALKHFFEDVQVIKPASSRSQSAEIFVVCMKYTNPTSIDPRMLDPTFVFKQVEDPSEKRINVLHKKHDQHQKRSRAGYDESLGMILHRTATVDEFIESSDPVQLLTDCNEITLTGPNIDLYIAHKSTTEEIRLSFQDLRVLGRTDFKMLLKWRLRMKKYKEDLAKGDQPDEGEDEESKQPTRPLTEAEKEELIQQEIEELKERERHKAKSQKKREREKQAQLRQRQALGMETAGLRVEDDQELFRLENVKDKSDLDAVVDVDLDQIADPFLDTYHTGEVQDSDDNWSDIEDEDEALEEELNYHYGQYLARKKSKGADAELEGTRFAKRSKLRGTAEAQAMQREMDDAAIFGEDEDDAADARAEKASHKVNADVEAYAKMLASGKGGSDSDSSDDDEDDSDSVIVDEADVYNGEKTPALIMKRKEQSSVRADRWFSNPIFGDVLTRPGAAIHDDDADDADGAAAETVASLPRTDKELRKEKRKKLQERAERRQLKRSRHLEEDNEIDVVRTNADGTIQGLDAQEAQRRELIRKGMGKVATSDAKAGFEVVPADAPLALDERKYDSDNEEYTDHDRAVTLALGTLMLRRSRAKNLVDASYNRYAWNDSKDLPEWFVDDEVKHNRPQVPVPPALLEKMKERFQSLASKPIKKVAEARARKKRRAVAKLKTAKKKAASLAANPDMSERQKLKAIQATLKNKKIDKPGKVYVVARKSKNGIIKSSQKGSGRVKMVDARMKKEKRAEKRKRKR